MFGIPHQAGDTATQQLLSNLDVASNEIGSFLTGIESGRIYRERQFQKQFRRENRIDEVLLGNLNATCTELEKSLGNHLHAQALVMQVMFVAYLEDRGIIVPEYFRQADPARQATTLLSLLADQRPTGLLRLFERLKKEFNGNVFVAPCSFEDSAAKVRLTQAHMEVLHAFREGRLSLEQKQYQFWPYDFKYIPVELISAIYDRFLGTNPDSRRKRGQYYTPTFLADLVIDQLLACNSEHGRSDPGTRALDAACGSGIFLVRLFQRRVEEWRRAHSGEAPSWPKLIAMMKRLHGCDVDQGAIRVAAVSLYIALLEQVDPPSIRDLARRGRVLPMLVGVNLHCGDFLDFPLSEAFDLLVGNPPWVGARSNSKTFVAKAKAWCEARKYPIPDDQVAWGFVWKGLEHIPGGHFALVLPAMDFLVKQNSANARSRLFAQNTISRVLNLGDFSFLLFDSEAPTAVYVGQAVKAAANYRFNYLCPKGDPDVWLRGALLVSATDRTKLDALRITSAQESRVNDFKVEMWARSPDRRLLSKLAVFPTLRHRTKLYEEFSRRHQSATTSIDEGGWVLGQGLQTTATSGTRSSKSSLIGQVPHLEKDDLTAGVLTNFPSKHHVGGVRRFGFEEGYYGQRVLIGRVQKRDGRPMVAAYEDRPLTFGHTVIALRGCSKNEDSLKLAAAILNSHLAVWFYLHTATSVGMERGDLRSEEILSLPFPQPEDLPQPADARQAAKQIVALLDGWRPQSALTSPVDERQLCKLDQLIYRYYGLDEQEIALIEDTAVYIQPSIQPREVDVTALAEKVGEVDYSSYAHILKTRLADWMPGQSLDTHILEGDDLALLQISLSEQIHLGTQVSRMDKQSLRIVDDFYGAVAKREDGVTLLNLADVRLFSGRNLYLLKPRTRRHWLRATALADADDIAADLFAAQSIRPGRGANARG